MKEEEKKVREIRRKRKGNQNYEYAIKNYSTIKIYIDVQIRYNVEQGQAYMYLLHNSFSPQ